MYREINRDQDTKMSLCELHKRYLLSLIKLMMVYLQLMKKGMEDKTVTRGIGRKSKPTHVV